MFGTKTNRAVRPGVTIAVACALGFTFLTPTSAQAAEPVSACGLAAQNVANSEEAQAAGIIADGPLNFSCAPDGVIVSSTDDQGKPVATYEEVVDDERPQDSAFSVARQMAPQTLDPVCDSAVTEARRYVLNNYAGQVNFCVFYGQTGSPVNGTWVRSIYNTLTINLQTVTHLLTFSSENLDFAGVNAAELSGFIYMRNNQGILPPVVTDELTFNLSEGGSTANFSAYIGGTNNGVYNVSVADMNIVDYDYAFSTPIQYEANTFRFLCQTGEQCNYPDGMEAPVF